MLKTFFYLFIVKPVMLFISGMSVKNYELIPQEEQFIIIANHNSHLDIMAIMALFDVAYIKKIRPVAASDYFFRNKILKWISINLIDIIPLSRAANRAEKRHPLQDIYDAIDAGYSLVIFPEGSRGKPDELQNFKNGIGHIASKYPDLPIVPIVLEDTAKALPKDEALFVPFIIKAEVKEATTFHKANLEMKEFVKKLEELFKNKSPILDNI